MVHILCFVCSRLRYTILLIHRVYNTYMTFFGSAIKCYAMRHKYMRLCILKHFTAAFIPILRVYQQHENVYI